MTEETEQAPSDEKELPLEPSNEGRPSLPEDLCVPARNWPKARK